MTRFRSIIGITLALAASGCETLKGPQPVPVPPTVVAPPPQPAAEVQVPKPVPAPEPARSASDVENILIYFEHMKKLSANELVKEHESARQAFARSKSDMSRLRLALLLSFPSAPFREDAKALELIEPMVKDARGQYTPLRGFAYVLSAFIVEQKRLGSHVQNLQEKLDALKSLEKSLNERQRGESPRSR